MDLDTCVVCSDGPEQAQIWSLPRPSSPSDGEDETHERDGLLGQSAHASEEEILKKLHKEISALRKGQRRLLHEIADLRAETETNDPLHGSAPSHSLALGGAPAGANAMANAKMQHLLNIDPNARRSMTKNARQSVRKFHKMPKLQERCNCEKDDGRVEIPIFCPRYSFMLHPDTKPLEIFERVLTCLVLYVAISVPFKVAFSSSQGLYLTIWECALDLIFLADFVRQIRTGVRDKATGHLIMNPIAVRRRAMTSWGFYIDMISSIPFELAEVIISSFANAEIVARLASLKVIRLSKLSRIVRLFRLMARLEEHLEVSHAVVRLIHYVLGLLFCIHMTACAWWGLASLGSFATADEEAFRIEWLPDTELETLSLSHQYAHAVWFATRALLYGQELWPRQVGHLWFSIFIQLLGVFMVSFIIGSVGGLVAELDQESLERRRRIESVMRFCRANRVTDTLKDKIYSYLWYKLDNISNDHLHLAKVKSEMSGALSQELEAEIWARFLDMFRWFFDKHFIEDYVAVEMLAYLKIGVFGKDEMVYAEGEVVGKNPSMAFVMDGELDLLRNGVVINTICAGNVIGENCVFKDEKLRREQVNTRTPSTLFLLERRELQKVLSRVVLQYQLGQIEGMPQQGVDGLPSSRTLTAGAAPLLAAGRSDSGDAQQKAAAIKNRIGDWGFVFEDPLEAETPNAVNMQKKFFDNEGDDFVRLAEWLQGRGHTISVEGAGASHQDQEAPPVERTEAESSPLTSPPGRSEARGRVECMVDRHCLEH